MPKRIAGRRSSEVPKPRDFPLPFVACELLESRMLLSAAHAAVPALHGRAHPMDQIFRHHSKLHPFATPAPTGLTPAQMRQYYGVDQINFNGTAGDGTGETIAIVDAYDDPNAAADLHSFDAQFGLPDPSFQQVNQNGGANLPSVDPSGRGKSSWEVEESLDIEWSHVIAPAASIVLVECNSNNLTDLFQGASTAAGLSGVVAVSMSFGGGEFVGERSNDSTFTTPSGHNGVTFLAATGDSGQPGNYPAFSPNVIAVGGTTIPLDPVSGAPNGTETAWSGSGGGTSITEPQPAYQQSVETSGQRDTPDIAMDADPHSGVSIYDSYDFGTSTPWAQFGGTSLSTPMWAGLIAIADQGRALNGLGSLDGATQVLPKLYSLPQADYHIVPGQVSNGTSLAYDTQTGLGSPVANTLVNDLAEVAGTTGGSAQVVGRFVFYNNSAYDGNNPAANSADDAAIAPDKQALRPGTAAAQFQNYTSYSKGINGIMIDVSGLAGTPTAADFNFAVGNDNNTSQWAAAPAPSAVLVRPGAGVNGSSRIEITFPDGLIHNEWLQVTVNADANTGLSSADVFYFGNLIGESGKPAVGNFFSVTADDEAAAANDPHGFLSPAPLNDAQDYNRDGKVDATDQLIARYDLGASLFDFATGAPAGAPGSAPAARPAITPIMGPRYVPAARIKAHSLHPHHVKPSIRRIVFVERR